MQKFYNKKMDFNIKLLYYDRLEYTITKINVLSKIFNSNYLLLHVRESSFYII